ncbi:MAG: hypothetical protein V2I97_15815 [Desulfococcaceae bacterium]|nr:hypothetical protein [Desulfococcaceae bacterium]
MLIYDDIYTWDGWGGKFKLAGGRCGLRLFDLKKRSPEGIAHLKRYIAVVRDIPFEKQGPNQMSIKSCAGHIATGVVRDFQIDPTRMIWIEHYPEDPENHRLRYPQKERFEEVEFEWKEKGALRVQSRKPSPAVTELVKQLIFGKAST